MIRRCDVSIVVLKDDYRKRVTFGEKYNNTHDERVLDSREEVTELLAELEREKIVILVGSIHDATNQENKEEAYRSEKE